MTTSPSPLPPSDALRRVVDALLDGQTPPPDAQAALSELEKNEVAGLVRTAHLTRLSLRGAGELGNDGNGEAESLQKAQAALQSRIPVLPDFRSDKTLPWWERCVHWLKRSRI